MEPRLSEKTPDGKPAGTADSRPGNANGKPQKAADAHPADTNGRACSFRCAYDWPTLDACGAPLCLAAGCCSRRLELAQQERAARHCERVRRRARQRRLLGQVLERLGVSRRELRRLLLDLLADDLGRLLAAVRQEATGD